MVRNAVRRFLGLLAGLALVTIPIFWAVARTGDQAAGTGTTDPLFLNLEPEGARERALRAVLAVAAGGADAGAGGRDLARLGGAALPHVLPRLDALGPEARGRVALALAPVAERMGAATPGELDGADAAVLFWTRYWREHAIDFRPAAARRAVRRLAESPSGLRRAEVIELDTFALEDLVLTLRSLGRAGDPARLRALCEVILHVTASTDAPGGGVGSCAERWEDYWESESRDFVAIGGARRIAAMVVETRYGRWLEHVVRRGLGRLPDGRAASDVFREQGPVSLGLVLAGLLGGRGLALLAAAIVATRRRGTIDVAGSAATLLVGAVTPVGLVALVRPSGAPLVSGALVMIVGGAAAALPHARATHARLLESASTAASRAMGASRVRASLRALRLAAGPLLAGAMADLPGVATGAFVTERALALDGLGSITVEAAARGGVVWLMAMALVSILTIGLAQIAADVALGWLDPRVSAGGSFRDGGRR